MSHPVILALVGFDVGGAREFAFRSWTTVAYLRLSTSGGAGMRLTT